jgi:hypothetical protein
VLVEQLTSRAGCRYARLEQFPMAQGIDVPFDLASSKPYRFAISNCARPTGPLIGFQFIQ